MVLRTPWPAPDSGDVSGPAGTLVLMASPLDVTTVDPGPSRTPWYDPTITLAAAMSVAALTGAATQYANGVEIGLPRVGARFASRDLRKFKVALSRTWSQTRLNPRPRPYGGSIGETGTELYARLTALVDAGLGEMMSADALAWQCALLTSPPADGVDPVDLIARWEQFTNHGWLAHTAGFTIAEIEDAGAAPGDHTVQMMLALRGSRSSVPKVRTPERLGANTRPGTVSDALDFATRAATP